MLSEEEYPDDEYINKDNDPCSVERVTDEDYFVVEDEQTVGFDEVFETVSTEIVDFVKHDHMMEEKVLDALRRGKLK